MDMLGAILLGCSCALLTIGTLCAIVMALAAMGQVLK